jgi:hypothetical protein
MAIASTEKPKYGTSGVAAVTEGGGVAPSVMSMSFDGAAVSGVVHDTLVEAKGDLVTATADDAPARLAAGSDGSVLTADSTAATGLRWASRFPRDMDDADMASRIVSGSLPLCGWTYPVYYGGSFVAQTDGRLSACKIWVPRSITVTGMCIFLGDQALTSPDYENALALYASDGTLIGKTADQSAAWGSGTTTLKTADLVGGPYSIAGGDGVYVYAAVLMNTNGGTPAKFASRYTISYAFGNMGQSAGASSSTLTHGYRESVTAIPSSLWTLTAGGYPFWMGLY